MDVEHTATRRRAVTALTEGRDSILAVLEARLRASASPVAADPGLWSAYRDRAAAVISDCAGRVLGDDAAAPAGSAAADVMLATLILDTLATAVGSATSQPMLAAGQALHDRLASADQTRGVGEPGGAAAPAPAPAELVQAERRRSAREIHDRIGNRLSLAIRHLDLYEIYRERSPEAAESKIGDIRAVLEELLDGTRRLMSDLRFETPVGSLAEALRQVVDAVNPSVAVDIAVRGDEELIPAEHRDELFVVLREALRNVFTHAAATSASVRVAIDGSGVTAAVVDDGTGFDLVHGVPGGRGTGRASMRERIELLGGVWAIAANQPHGTRVEMTIPLPR